MQAIFEEHQIWTLRTALTLRAGEQADEKTVGALLRILEWRGAANEGAIHYLRSAATGGCFRLEQEEKIWFETASWVHALEQALRPGGDTSTLEWLSPNLREICRSRPEDSRPVLARTLRMALLLQALLLHDRPTGNPYMKVLGACGNIHPGLSELVGRLRGRTAPFGNGGNLQGWSISLPLLVVLAVAESQCEYREAQPFVWEAYGAGRAHEELKRQWGDAGTDIDRAFLNKVLNTVALLIRCQSAVGQRMRGTGGGRLLRLVEQNKMKLCFEPAIIYDALTLLAIVGEARNHQVPGEVPDAYRNADISDPWDDAFLEKVARYLEFDPKQHINDEPTWQYFGSHLLGLPDDRLRDSDIREFKKTIEEWAEFQKEHLRVNQWKDFEVVSFGRHHASPPLNQLVRHVISSWSDKSSEQRQQTFNEFFDLHVLEVPNPFNTSQTERTLQVVLKDYLAAERLLFPSETTMPSPLREPMAHSAAQPAHTAADLVAYLLDIATRRMHLKDDAGCEPSEDKLPPLYAPFPLIHRITTIVHRLMPDNCFAIPLNIDHQPTEWVYLPYGIKQTDNNTDAMLKRILTNYLLAAVLNRGMAAGIRYAEIDLRNLSTPRDTGPDWMGPAHWQRLVEAEYNDGGYETILGRYLRDFNTLRENVALKARLALDVREANAQPKALAVGAVREDLGRYLKTTEQPDFWLLGVDIGGTLTKCQLFHFVSGCCDLDPCGPVFHMATRSTPEQKADLDKEPDNAERAKKATLDFARRLVELTRKRSTHHVDAINKSQLLIGVTWPGPVRENHVAGTSGILEQFGLTRDIKKNRIEDIWEVDVAKAVRQAWEERFGEAPRCVFLLNDGDADAVGAVVGAEAAGSSARDYPDGHVVSVVKLGTGLAGAVLDTDHGRLVLRPGLFEWGKLILDLAGPRRKPSPKGGATFPQGVASEFLSKRRLSQLASKWGEGKFQKRDEPDSAEIGLILEVSESADPKKPYRDLVLECGALQAERRPRFGLSVSAEVYRLVYKDPGAEPDLIFEVRLAMNSYGNVTEALKESLHHLGQTRLERLIGPVPTEQDVDRAALKVARHDNFTAAAAVARRCVTSLGRYLGDFCVTLYDHIGVAEFRLTGGVLSGATGKIAREAACERVQQYGLEMNPAEREDVFAIRKPTEDTTAKKDGIRSLERDRPEPECGALGAACFAAAAFLEEQKQEEVQKLRLEMLRRPSGAQVRVQETEEKVSVDEFAFPALSKEELLRFLRIYGPDWRFYQTQDPDLFVKW